MSGLVWLLISLHTLFSSAPKTYANPISCRTYCGNLTISYPFALQQGCGHPGFRDLLFCINDVLMFHISSGSYRVLDIDYAYKSLTLHDPHLSTCESITLGQRGNGFVVEEWRVPYLTPSGDNVFMLLGCSAKSPLFQGFPGKHLPCRNVSGMGCEEYYGCSAWTSRQGLWPSASECCAVPYGAIKAVNLTKLDCQGYSSVYNLAPVRVMGPDEWTYGIRVGYSMQGNEVFCRGCESSGGVCGYEMGTVSEVCICSAANSTVNCEKPVLELNRAQTHFKDNWVVAVLLLLLSLLPFHI
ncbi:uncharacterized protein LOC124945499 [Impatiens glandulifera]|uniref:uncharacterized protein LOC124945499 n=1 Tax=Impatiens glandulifera TaxID=253017 RepID=UPI001FB05626|nr:uncharacterized protein LOC124945499 [Impatiens glandulifera]